MQKKAAESGAENIAVSVSRLGNDPIPLCLPVGSTVSDALAKAGVSSLARTEYFVSGVKADSNDILEDGDVLACVTAKQAGSY